MITFQLVHSPPVIIPSLFAGAAVGTGTMQGSLSRMIEIAADAIGVGTTEAAIAGIAGIAGIAQGVGLMDAGLAPSVALIGSVEAIGVAQGVIENLGTLEGNAAAVGAATAAISALVSLAGSAAGVGMLAAYGSNFLLYSDDTENENWLKVGGISAFGSGSVANTTAVTDPLGGTTANFVRFTTSSNIDQVVQILPNYSPAQTSTFACWFKFQTGGVKWVKLFILDEPQVNYVAASFDIETGTLGPVVNGVGGTGVSSEIIAGPNGWYLCIVRGQPDTVFGTGTRVLFRASSNGTSENFTGDNVHGVYVWRAQLTPDPNPANPLPYTTSAAVTVPTLSMAGQASGLLLAITKAS